VAAGVTVRRCAVRLCAVRLFIVPPLLALVSVDG
jgi:hypothetical protein